VIIKSKGLKVFMLGIVFNLLESLYFGQGTDMGFNLKPQSVGEFICDDISIILIVIGSYLMAMEINHRRN
jgi:hypothetical protein